MVLETDVLGFSDDGTVARTLRELRKDNEILQVRLHEDFDKLKTDTLQALGNLRADVQELNAIELVIRQKDEVNDQQDASEAAMEKPINVVPFQTVSGLAEQGRFVFHITKILKSLYFRNMESRRTRIADAHHKTFEWALKSNITNWIKSSDFLFWVGLAIAILL